jgi:hypothetical protein
MALELFHYHKRRAVLLAIRKDANGIAHRDSNTEHPVPIQSHHILSHYYCVAVYKTH